MADFLIRNGDFLCGICIAPDGPATAVTAAGELVRCLSAASGVQQTIRYGLPEKGEICLGAKSADCAAEELRIEVKDDILWVDGGKRGIIYGVYELLEQLGFRFLTADCEVIPKAAQLTVDDNLNICQKPAFEYRCTSWREANVKSAPRYRLNAVLDQEIPESWGGSVNYEGGFVHTLGELAEMEKIDGEYTDRQPCLTDEKTFQTVVKNIRKKLQANPAAGIVSVSQNDSHPGVGGCGCANCRAIDEAEGTPMGSLLHFVNRVAQELEPEFPDLAIDTLSYAYTQKTTAHMDARDNVIIRLCASGKAVVYPLETEDPGFTDSLRKWAKHCKRIYIWDYTTNFRSYHNPFPNFGILRQNALLFAQNNVQGVFEQGNHQTTNGEFGALRAYLFGKLLWDPYMSEETYQRHINEFMEGFYGPGWKHIRRYFDRLHAGAQGDHSGINFVDPSKRFVDPELEGTHKEKVDSFLKKARADFAAATAEADETQRKRIKQTEIQVDVYEWYVRYNELNAFAEDDPDRTAALQALYTAGVNLYAHVLSFGITLMYEDIFARTVFLTEMPDLTAHPFSWGNKTPDKDIIL